MHHLGVDVEDAAPGREPEADWLERVRPDLVQEIVAG